MADTRAVTLQEVEKVLPLKTWWAAVAVLPVVRRLTLLAVNHTGLTPNMVTVTSIVLRVVAAGAFASGMRVGLIAGAACFYAAYVLDCMDGAIARLKRMSSEFGRFLDHIGDLFGGVLSVAGLAYGWGMLASPIIIGLLLCHVSEYYISYLTSTVLSLRKGATPGRFWTREIPRSYLTYRKFFHCRNMKSFISFPDYEAMVFFVFPLAGCPVQGLYIGFITAVVIICYTIFSSFVAIHVGGAKFP